MLKRKEKVGKRQFYRRVACNFQTVLNEIIVCNDGNQNVSNVKEAISCNIRNCDVHSQKSKNITEVILHNNSDVNIADIRDTFDDNNDYMSDTITDNSVIISDKSSIDFNKSFQSVTNNSESESTHILDLKTLLTQWILQFQISHVAVNYLLQILSPLHPELPLDSRTLLKTPISLVITKLENGEYCHIGIKSGLKSAIFSTRFLLNDIIELSCNIDGVPLFVSSNIQLWPISCLVKNFESKPFIAGLFCGTAKPKPLDKYLSNFVDELSDLLQNGFNFNNKIYTIKIHSFICDAPAKAYVKCIKSHGGYHACDKCTENGEFHGRVIYPGINAKLRTDTSFLLQEDEEHHMGISPLLKLNVGMISVFPIDYMHNTCLGVTRKLLYEWLGINRNANIKVRLHSRFRNSISDHLISLRPFVTVEFNRKPRSLLEIQRWKATEFRTFLVYLGPLILKDIVDLAIYEHFLLLNCAITILLSKKHISKIGLHFTRNLLNTFISHSKKIYGKQFIVYNVHSLCHLPDDVEKYGPLDSFSAFPFENYFGKIKTLVKSPHKPLEQICRRLNETLFLDVQINKEKSLIHFMQHTEGPLLSGLRICKQYKKLVNKKCTFCISSYSLSDSYLLTNKNKVIQIDNIITNSENKTF